MNTLGFSNASGSARAIDRIIAGHFPLYNYESARDYEARLEQCAADLTARGVTHVRINFAVCSLPWAMDPMNSYLRFTTYGPSLDRYVESSWNRGIYHHELLEANRRLLLAHAALAKKYGFRTMIQCVEPTLMQESFFRRHPRLRGPRVDNPAMSTTPYYALCALAPETQDHYRQLLRQLLALVPELDEIHIFTNDSGSGICYSEHLYSGPNGPIHCRQLPPGKQAQTLCRTLLDTGRERNPEFRVVMTSGLSPREKLDFCAGAPAGIASAVYGVFGWSGGLEDRWANMALGPQLFRNPVERQKIRAWQEADMLARIKPLRQAGSRIYVSYETGYYADGDEPRPFEAHDIMARYVRWGVTDLIGGGPGGYSINGAVTRHVINHGPQPTETVVREIALAWVGPKVADRLVEAWRLSDHAFRERPMAAEGGHEDYFYPLLLHMPIVPDESKLAPGDLDYFLTPALADEQNTKARQGGVWRKLHLGDDLLVAYLEQYEQEILPRLDRAIAILRDCLNEPELTTAARECLNHQIGCLRQPLHTFRHMCNWYRAALHKIAGYVVPAGYPSLAAVIQAEIDLQDAVAKARGLPNDPGPRVALMRRHLADPLRKVDLTEFPPHRHLGTAGWTPAHE